MSGIIKLSKKNHLILDNHFKNAPKSYKEALGMGHTPHIPIGKKYKDLENEGKIISELFDSHTSKNCSCSNKVICLFKKYENKEITLNDIIELTK